MRRCLNCMNEYQEKYEDVCPHCGYVHGATQERDVSLRPGGILQGRYIVGTVKTARDIDLCYIGWDALFDRKVLIREYFPRYCATRSSREELTVYDAKKELFEKGLELFYSQSRELIRLYQEPDVITFHACFRENQTAYAVMEYREEQTLREVFRDYAAGEGEGLEFLQKAMRAVKKAHRLGIPHGRIGPDSFWVTADEQVILKDFGSWRYVSGEPGIIGYGNAGTQTDVYGLAKLFCWMMTGREPEDGDSLEMDFLKQNVNVSKRVMIALKHALACETRSIYRFSEELGGNLEEEAVDSYSRNRLRRRDAKKRLSLPKWIYAAAVAGLAVAGITAGLMFNGTIDLRIGAGRSRLEKNMVRVPNVVNATIEEAEHKLAACDLEMVKGKAAFSDEIPENMVCYQEIKENTKVEKGTRVVVWISKGRNPTEVGTAAAESTAESTEATAESAEATEGSAKATEESVEATAEATKAAAKPTEAAAKPTEAAAKPTEAAAKPTKAAAKPTEEAAKPTKAAAKPTKAAAKPTDAAAKPTEAKPTEAAAKPTEAAVEPAASQESGVGDTESGQVPPFTQSAESEAEADGKKNVIVVGENPGQGPTAPPPPEVPSPSGAETP